MKPLKLLTGVMPDWHAWTVKNSRALWLIDCCLRASGQIMFAENPISGLLFLVGIAVESGYVCVGGCIGMFASNLAAVLMGVDKGMVSHGLAGYNGVLVGCALGAFHMGSDAKWSTMPWIFAAIALMSVVSLFLTMAFGNLLVSRLKMTPLTFPFQVTTWIWLLGAQSYFYFPINGTVLQPHLSVVPTDVPVFRAIAYEPWDVFLAFWRNIGQVFLCGNVASGIMFLIGIFICSPIAALSTVIGSATCIFISMGLGVSEATLYFGLWGFNPVLSAIALGGFFVVWSWPTFWLTVFSSIVSTLVFGAVASFFAPLGMPALTFPFTFCTWIFLLVGTKLPGMTPTPMSWLNYHEDHYYRLKRVRIVQTLLKPINTALPHLAGLTIEQIEPLMPGVYCYLAARGHESLLKDLIKAGADLAISDYAGKSPLHYAVAHDQRAIVDLLLNAGVPVNPVDNNGHTPLDEAGSLASASAQELKNRGGQNKAVSQVHNKAESKQDNGPAFKPSIRKIQVASVDVNAESDSLIATILAHEAAQGNALAVGQAIEASSRSCIDVGSLQDCAGQTLLHVACMKGKHEVVQLIAAITDGAVQNRQGLTPLWLAVTSGHSLIAKILVAAGAQLGVSSQSLHQYLFSLAGLAEDPIRLQQTLRVCVGIRLFDVNATDSNGWTLLHAAVSSRNKHLVSTLLALGASVNIADSSGVTPLSVAKNSPEMLKLLSQVQAQGRSEDSQFQPSKRISSSSRHQNNGSVNSTPAESKAGKRHVQASHNTTANMSGMHIELAPLLPGDVETSILFYYGGA